MKKNVLKKSVKIWLSLASSPFAEGKLTVVSIIAFYKSDHSGTFDSLMSGSRSCIALRVKI